MDDLMPVTIIVSRAFLISAGLSLIATILTPMIAHFWPGAKEASKAQTKSINDEYFAQYPGLVDTKATDVFDIVWSEPQVF